MTITATTNIQLVDGTTVDVDTSLAESFRGLVNGEYGLYLVIALDMKHADGSEYLISLTDCCNASGKGGEYGIICRNCYNDVEEIHAAHILPEELIARV